MTEEKHAEAGWRSMEDLKAECERLRAFVENWILILDPEPGTTINVPLMQEAARKVLGITPAIESERDGLRILSAVPESGAA